MNLPLLLIILNWAIISLSLVGLGVMVLRGALREQAIALGPEREVGLTQAEYVFGAALVLGHAAFMMVSFESDSALMATLSGFFPILLTSIMINRLIQTQAGLRKSGLVPCRPRRDLVWALIATPLALGLAAASGMLVNYISTVLGSPLEEVAHETLKALRERPTWPMILTVILSAVIIAPLFEEVVFRGVLQTCLIRLFGERRWPALLYAATLFAIVHAWVVPWQNLVPLFVLGLVFGYVYERTGSLLAAVLTHAGFNAVNIAIVVAMPA